jgi:Icc-related predicted phosphoesterase
MSCRCLFVSDLHGRIERYDTLFSIAEEEKPDAIFLGGDLLPHRWSDRLEGGDFIEEVLVPGFDSLRETLDSDAPQVFVILGNDDYRSSENIFIEGHEAGRWFYAHQRWGSLGSWSVFGYAYVPPTPFLLKDWERYDVSRFTDAGCVSPERGQRTVPVDPDEIQFGTIAADLAQLTGDRELKNTVCLFHSPPYRSDLDRAELDGRSIDYAPLDVHVGSIAIQRFIEDRQPLLTLHGHIHESPRLTGTWRQRIGRTHAFTAAHDGPELALVRFDLDDLESATRDLL